MTQRAASASAAAQPPPVSPIDEPSRPALERQRFRQRYLPSTEVLTHTGRPVRFYEDLVRERKVVIGVMYTSCQNLCVPITHNLVQARQQLGALGQALHFILISLTPLQDRPADLRSYMERHGLASGWTLVTGTPSRVEEVTMSLGLLPRNPEDRNLSAHASMVKVGDEARVRWGHAAALARPKAIARMIRFELV